MRRAPDLQTSALARLRALLGPAPTPPAPATPPVAAVGPGSGDGASAAGAPVGGAADGPPASVAALLGTARVDPSRRGAIALVALAVVAAVLAGAYVLRGRPAEVPLVAPPPAGQVVSEGGPEIVVDVAGRVRKPGLVHLPDGARVDDALRAAGGVLPGVPTVSLNLARKLVDGEQLVVGLEAAGPSGGGASAGGLLDLNLATVQDFDGLPGIGPVLAQRIVDWRTEHGRFASVDQLREVSGIGEAKYSTLKSKVRV